MTKNTNTAVTSTALLEDTHPIKPIRKKEPLPKWRQIGSLICLLGAGSFTVATAIVLFLPSTAGRETTSNNPSKLVSTPTIQVEETIGQLDSNPKVSNSTVDLLPTISPEMAQNLLTSPLIRVESETLSITRNVYEPFTIIPDRPRSEVIEYEVVTGDTINSIAEKFGLKPETIAWSNPRSIVQVLRPGDRVIILPVDGVYHMAIGSSTISEIAAQYGVNPYTILESEFNQIADLTPDSIPLNGARLVIAGGIAEQISWSPPVVRVDSTSGGNGNSSGGSQISFAAGDPGSCGLVNNPGGGGAWVRPINGYTWIRGFASWHPAVDLAAPQGTSVYAANGGRVIFAGWSSWGYGYTVVLAHGPFTTIYAHLSRVDVSCGQDIAPGQQVAATGNSGNSSGPHLHFEIRYQDTPQDPTFTIPF